MVISLLLEGPYWIYFVEKIYFKFLNKEVLKV